MNAMLPRFLFCVTVGSAAGLFLLVIVAPWLDNTFSGPRGWLRLVALFAHDATLRRTALASALGLLVTAFVFFRRPRLPRRLSPRRRRLPPPPTIAGA